MSKPTKFATQTPPAVFPVVFGALGLALAWRRATDTFGVPRGFGDALFGMALALFVFCLFAYLLKVLRRPGVLRDEMPVLPGRVGLTAMVLCLYLSAAGIVPFSTTSARALLAAGLIAHIGLLALFAHWWLGAPHEQRGLNPSWHLHFVGFVIADLSAIPLGLMPLSQVIYWATMAIAVAIWAGSAVQLVRRVPPAPLRPLLAIHLAPASLMGTVSLLLGYTALAQGFAWFGGAILIALLFSGRWITVAGFSPLWGAFTFPLAAYGALCLLLAAAGQGAGFRVLGGVILVAATLIIPPIVFKVMQAWARGGLAVKTNAARV